ncbi:MAG: adenine phosphoribosyltransferase [Clostridiales bacterium]|nr:adenine phosphoribosyltransferase [Clostridiales bacterium]
MGIILDSIRTIPDFPAKGVMFRDITTLLKDPIAMTATIDEIADSLVGYDFNLVAGPESRGFIFSMPLAYNLKKGFIPVRKKGKLPAEVISKEYNLEYGTEVLEIHKDAISPGDRVVIIDDLLATGGTAKAICELIEEMGATVAALRFAIELPDLGGRKLLEGYDVQTVVAFEGE